MKREEIKGYFTCLEGSAFLSAGYHEWLAEWRRVRKTFGLEGAELERFVEEVN